MNTAIEIENLGKKYIISHKGSEQYSALRDIISDGVKKIVRPKKSILPQCEEFWALRNLSLEINIGEKLGVIGRNGAGKTTLLKILSRITSPSEGKVKLKGRVSSLLEVGTGFHPELTGRENIYLNGAILGLSRNDIKKRFRQIIEFAEIEKFLDTPVKRYSSGMYVRLAFAVAAHLEYFL
jgi:lipopolysaccharide transport system ATP-binding protein